MSTYPFRKKSVSQLTIEPIHYLLRLTNGQYAHPLKRQCQAVTLKSAEYEGKQIVRQGYGKEATTGEVILEATLGRILAFMRENQLTPSSIETDSDKENSHSSRKSKTTKLFCTQIKFYFELMKCLKKFKRRVKILWMLIQAHHLVLAKKRNPQKGTREKTPNL
jgi:hypothetical protein